MGRTNTATYRSDLFYCVMTAKLSLLHGRLMVEASAGCIRAGVYDPPEAQLSCARRCTPVDLLKLCRGGNRERQMHCVQHVVVSQKRLAILIFRLLPSRNNRRTADFGRDAPVRARRPAALPGTLAAPSHNGLALHPSPSRSPLASRKLLRCGRYIPLSLRSDCSQRWVPCFSAARELIRKEPMSS